MKAERPRGGMCRAVQRPDTRAETELPTIQSGKTKQKESKNNGLVAGLYVLPVSGSPVFISPTLNDTMRKLLHAELVEQRLSAGEADRAERHPVALLLHNIRSLYNVGSMFRTADAALAAELILCGYTPSPPRKEIEKTALGAVDTVPWSYQQSTACAIASLKERGYTVLALELTDKSRSYDEFCANDFPLCLVAGNEITGVDDDILALCDGAVQIPMFGVKHSLNVGVAAGIALFEAVRGWRGMAKP